MVEPRANIAELGERLRQIRGENDDWKLAGMFLLACFIVGSISPGAVHPENARSFLTTLIISQATLLGIVVSVTLLGIQLVADRYSPRLISVFITSNGFLLTFGLFVLSIGFDLFVLYHIPTGPSSLVTTAIYLSAGLVTVLSISLYDFVGLVLSQSTPDGLLQEYERKQTPEDFRASALEADSGESSHPLHELYQLTVNAIQRGEWLAAENSIDRFESISQKVMETDFDERKSVAACFQKPLEEYLPRIVAVSHLHDEDDLTYQGISSITTLGKFGFESDVEKCGWYATSGLSTCIGNSPDGKDGDQIRNRTLRGMSRIMVAGCENQYYRELSPAQSTYARNVRTYLFRKRDNYWVYQNILSDFYRRHSVKCVSLILNQEQFEESDEIDWSLPSNREDSAELLSNILESHCEISIAIYRYFADQDEQSFNDGEFYSTWKDLLQNTIEDGPNSLAVHCCELYIDAAYTEQLLIEGKEGHRWAKDLARVYDKTQSDVISEALNKRKKSEVMSPFIHIEMEQDEKRSKLRKMVTARDEHQKWVDELEVAINDWVNEYGDAPQLELSKS